MPQNFFSLQNLKWLSSLLLIVFACRWSLFSPWLVTSGSMHPTLEIGDRVLVSVMAYELSFPFSDWVLTRTGKVERGDIVVFRSPLDPRTDFVKRAAALEGDKICIKDGKVFVNDVEQGLFPTNERVNAPWPEDGEDFVVPMGSVFVLGDNLSHSLDSRNFGALPVNFIRGKVLFVLWNANRDEEDNLSVRWERALLSVH